MQISIFGADTLKRFTEEILRDGLEGCGCKVLLERPIGDFGIVQIHGSPAARAADLAIVRDLPQIVSSLKGCIVLLHRPDEIKDSIPEFREVLSELPAKVGLAMLGNLMIGDPFYQISCFLACRVIPHGFFGNYVPCMRDPVVIGSHTTWGEMRSVERAISLLKAVREVGLRKPIIGYFGGAPVEELSRSAVVSILERFDLEGIFALREFSRERWREDLLSLNQDTILLNPGRDVLNFDVTFNLQLYHYGKRVRLGESSGSLHASSGIPVIFEMNGSERIEGLQTIKVPYSDCSDVETADYRSAAQEIAALINSGEYLQVLNHNREMALFWDNKRVGGLYIEFLQALAERL